MSFTIDDILKKDSCPKRILQSADISNQAIDYCTKNKNTPQLLERMIHETNQCCIEDRYYHDPNNIFHQKPINETEELATVLRFQNYMELQRMNFPYWRRSLEYQGQYLNFYQHTQKI